MSNSTTKIWFEGLPSLDELKIPKKWPPAAPGNPGEGDRVKARPKPPLFKLEGTICKTKYVPNEEAFGELLNMGIGVG